MAHTLFASQLPDGRHVCIAPISLDAYEANDAGHLGDDTGYFIYEYHTTRGIAGIEVLGKAASYDAAMRLADLFAGAPQLPADPYAMTCRCQYPTKSGEVALARASAATRRV